MGRSEKIDCRANGKAIFGRNNTSTPFRHKKCLEKRGAVQTVTKRIDGTMRILYQDRSLKFRQIDIRPEQPQKQKVKTKRRTAYIPPADHPWRKFKIGRNASFYAEKNITETVA